jgi:hypothetical protein
MPEMSSSTRYETINALRRILDRHADTVRRGFDTFGERESFVQCLTDEVIGNLPHGVLDSVILPAFGADDRCPLAVRIEDDFHFYLAFCAEYLARLRHGDSDPARSGNLAERIYEERNDENGKHAE